MPIAKEHPMTMVRSHPRPHGPVVVEWPRLHPWVRACVLAEAIGMTAAASAAVLTTTLDLVATAAVAVTVAGGLVEGVALGVFQARALGAVFGGRKRRAWAVSTVLVAGLAWAGSAVVTGQGEGGAVPSVLLLVLGAAGIGAVMGVLLGGAQALVLRGVVTRPGRWVLVSALAWTPAMVVIFAGASLPSTAWPAVAVLLVGPPTGAAAGLVLGVLSARLTRPLGIYPLPTPAQE